jgi:O-antigen/teichoic acid export membrane protein
VTFPSRSVARARHLLRGDFVRHGLLVFTATMAINVLGYAYHFAISRRIGVEQYGVLSALNAGIMISTVVSQIASTIVIKYAAEFRAVGDRAHLAALVRGLILYGSIASCAVCAAGLVLARPIAAYLKISNVFAVDLTMLIVAIGITTPALRAVFAGIEDFKMFSVSSVLESVLKAVLGISLAYAGFGVVGAIAGWAVGSGVSIAYTIAVLAARFRRVPGAALYIDLRRLYLTTAGVALATICVTSISYADVLIVKHYADPTTAGLYGALSLSGKILLFVSTFVPTIVLPKATRQALSGISPVGVFLQALGFILALSGAGLVVYFFFPTFIITSLAGSSFAPAAPYVFSYGLAMVLLAALNVVVMYKIGIHRFDFVIPLCVCAVAEIVGIAVRHASLSQVIVVLIAGNGVALIVSAWRVTAPLRSPGAVQPADAAA